ncbi:hypothetical protein LEN26_015710 [Aphanomyces euteiches]|nr:hypothetical protein LEN26_015710 [Aphanomyces euteiches]KAH9124016.1 hypothetical protein AeMF1_005142 [Aphanomyces euteiches]KAH9185018.1 hypothetical protein AeNC1_013001 [Aphanomyces euteiches]
MHLCRYANCRSYGKLDGFCLIHAKSNVSPHTTPSRLTFTPPPCALPQTTKMPEPQETTPSLVPLPRIPALANGRLRCFAPQCGSPTSGDLPFCNEHQHCVLLVDTQPSRQTSQVLRKRRRMSSTEDAPKRVQIDELPRFPAGGPSMTEHDHARILANLGRSC